MDMIAIWEIWDGSLGSDQEIGKFGRLSINMVVQ